MYDFICVIVKKAVLLQPKMKKFFSQIAFSSSVRNVGKLLSANIIAQAIGLLIYPLLTRLYTPEDFGLFNLFLSIGGVLILLSTADYHNAIVLPEKEEDACAVTHLSLFPVVIMTFVLLLSLSFAGPIAGLFKTPDLAAFYWLLPPYVFLVSLWNVLNYWYIRRKSYSRISGYQISQSLFSAGYKSGFGFLGYLNGGLIWSSVLSPLCSLILSVSLSAKSHLRPLLSFSWPACKQAARNYSNFPKFSLPHSVVNYVASQLPVLLLTPVFSVREVGFWSMALLLSFAPISMISNALYQVFYQKTTEQVNSRQSIKSFYRRFSLWTLVAGIPFFTALWIVLPALTQWLLGDEWRVAGEYIRWLLPWLLSMFLCASTGYLFNIFAKQKQGLYFEIAIAVARLAGLCVGIYFHSFVTAIACYALASAVINMIQYGWLLSLVKKYEKSLRMGV